MNVPESLQSRVTLHFTPRHWIVVTAACWALVEQVGRVLVLSLNFIVVNDIRNRMALVDSHAPIGFGLLATAINFLLTVLIIGVLSGIVNGAVQYLLFRQFDVSFRRWMIAFVIGSCCMVGIQAYFEYNPSYMGFWTAQIIPLLINGGILLGLFWIALRSFAPPTRQWIAATITGYYIILLLQCWQDIVLHYWF